MNVQGTLGAVSAPPSQHRRGLISAGIGGIALVGLCLASLMLGARSISVHTALEALFHFDPSRAEHVILWNYRLPRTLLALSAGAGFGVAGALIQAATRNPLADPGILGVNAGAAFFVTLGIGLFGWQLPLAWLGCAMAGAVSVTALVYAIGATGARGPTPLRMVLSGVAVSAFLGGTGSGVALFDPVAFDGLRHWAIGSPAGRGLGIFVATTPAILAGLVLALVAAPALNALALGDDLAQALGAKLWRTRGLVLLSVTLLAGGATAAVGPIGFIGLMVPHAVRWAIGPDQRWIVPLTLLYGAVLLIAADLSGRLLLGQGELEAGIVTAFLGAPVLIALARRREARGL
ncbi:FecCD family ABC transporter permease [Celeribacter sp. ULVN23_4]